MGHYYQEHKNRTRKSGKLWGNRGSHSRSGYGKAGKGKIILACLVLVAVAAIVWQVNTGSASSLKTGVGNVTNSVKNSYNQALAWSNAKLGLTENEFVLPVSSGVVVQEYGVVLNEGGEESYHSGVDIQVPAGSEILAAEGGEVIAVDSHDDSTFWVTISHSGGWSTVYGRLGEAKVAVGDSVEKGMVLGTPQSETLHFEVLEAGAQKNPINYFEAK